MINYKNEITKDILNSHNVKDEYKDLQVETRKRIQSHDNKPFAVGLLNVTGELNASVLIRTAALFGAENIFVFGRKEIDNRAHVGAINYVNVHFIKCLNEDLSFNTKIINDTLFQYKYWPLFVEQGGIPVDQFVFNEDDPKWCLLFGNEGRGIPENVLKMEFSNIISIPQVGVMRSHNVSVCGGIIMYELCRRKGWLGN